MTNSHKNRIRMAALALGALLFLVPVSVSPGEHTRATVNDACAGDKCCPEAGSFCMEDGKATANMGPAPPTGCPVEGS
jgi:hypothetical protein